MNYPEEIGMGFSFQFKDRYRSLFEVDWTRENWNAFTSAITSVNGVPTGNIRQRTANYKTANAVGIGFEHWLNDSMPVRYGFRYQEFYQMRYNTFYDFYTQQNIVAGYKPTLYSFTGGIGYVLEYFDVDFGCEFGKRNYDITYSDRYDELFERFMLTFRWRYGGK
jgi:hypothetical protein